jgi:exodeoxyribonuclease III
MRVASWNVNSLAVRLPHVLDWLKEYRPNVLCMQETKLIDVKFPRAEFEELGYHCEFHGEKSYNGVAILSDTTPDRVQKGFEIDSEAAARRFLEITVNGVTVICVYIPNGSAIGSDKFFYKLTWIELLKSHLIKNHNPEEMLAICGDYNVAPEARDVFDPVAMAGQLHFSPEEHAALQSVKDWGLVDTFRLHTEEAGCYSWWDYRMGAFRRNMGLRIDHIWATKSLADKCVSSIIDKAPRKKERPSDHAPIMSEFSL